MKEPEGLIQVYTGDGKGKTTAAVGLAVRAVGQGLKVCYLSFFKEPAKWGYGEHRVLKKLGVATFGFADKHPHFYRKVSKEEVRRECMKAMEFIRKIYREKKYDILILDEVLVSLRDGFLEEKEVLDILDLKPKDLELVLTGRGATKKIVKKADLVSEIKKVKHPYDSGIKGRKGIEY
ncbi:MAG: cob(I)yrinic acid a,c-diamide adenosyltransferase [Candidatus Omnitrophota bacterium]